MSEYEVIFLRECRQKLEDLAPPDLLQESLETVLTDLGNNPFAFDSASVVEDSGEVSTIRYARVGIYVSERGVVPPLTLFFGISDSRKQVVVLEVMPGSGFGIDPGAPN